MHRRTVLTAVTCAWLTALPAAAAETGAQAVDAAWKKAVLANDVEAIVKTYAKDAVAWLPDMSEARGEAAIRAAYQGMLDANTAKDVKLTDTHYKTVGNASIGWGRFSLTLVPKKGGNPIVLTGRFMDMAEKRDGKWVYVVDHASNEPPPPPAPAAGAIKK
jgi:ketosteroid isomerase-like protein